MHNIPSEMATFLPITFFSLICYNPFCCITTSKNKSCAGRVLENHHKHYYINPFTGKYSWFAKAIETSQFQSNFTEKLKIHGKI